MAWWGNLSHALNAFWVTLNANGRDTELVPVDALEWDSYEQRIRRYELFTAFATHQVYSTLYRYARQRMETHNLYKFTRSIYNPSARLIELYSSMIYGGALDMEHLTGGAIPLVTDNQALLDAVKQVFVWSRMPELKNLYPRNGAQYGDAPMKIIDDPAKEKVRIELLDPRKLKDVVFDSVGNVKSCVIEYERSDSPNLALYQPSRSGIHPLEQNPQTYLYTEIIDRPGSSGDGTADTSESVRFRTYKNGEPFAFTQDEDGQDVTEWTMPYGFVPVVVAGHKPTPQHWYRNAFDTVIPGIDAANDAASMLADQIRKATNPIWAFIGVSAGNLDLSVDKKDAVPYIKLPTGGDAKPLVFPLDISGALANLKELLSELERNAPELALQHIRDNGGNLTAPGVTAAYGDAIGRIQEAAGNYDGGLIRALQMCVSIGGWRGYEGFQGFSLDSYAAGDLDIHVKDRVIVPDELPKQAKITALQGTNGLPSALQRLVLKEMDYSDQDIEAVVSETAANQQAARQDQINANDATAVQALLDKMGMGGQNANPNTGSARMPEPMMNRTNGNGNGG